jgi:energy-coupling factor transporter transmembrane protein EcfT
MAPHGSFSMAIGGAAILNNPFDTSTFVYLKLGFLFTSVILALYTNNLALLAFMNAAIVLVCLLFSDLFREILAVVLRIAIGFPFLLIIYVISAWTVSGTLVAAVVSGSLGAALFILKIHFVVWANLILVRTTEPQHLVSALGKLRTPRELCLMIVIILRFFSVMFEEATAVYQTQRARGFEFHRTFNPVNWLPLAVPLVVNVMKKSQDLAVILELKDILNDK